MISETSATTVAAAFGLGDAAVLTGPVARGEMGRIWRMDTSSGTYAVKESFDDPDPDEADRASSFQAAAMAAGVPTARPHRARTGSYLVDVDGDAVRVYDWVDLHDLDLDLDPAQVGALLANLHRVHVPVDDEVHPWFTTPVGAARWDELAEESLRRDAPFAESFAAVVPELVAMETVIGPVRPVQLCHLDLWANNLRSTPSGALCLIDWENAGPGDPSHEVAMVLFEFTRSDPARTKALHTSYVEHGGQFPVEDRMTFGTAAAALGHITEMHVREWLAANNDDSRAHHERGVWECALDPLTLRIVDELVASAVS